jgi:hypothetical protein
MLIDIAISGDKNVIKKKVEMVLKCRNLRIGTQRTQNVETEVRPVTIKASGTISQSFRKYLNTVPGDHYIKDLQNTAILSTVHIVRKSSLSSSLLLSLP